MFSFYFLSSDIWWFAKIKSMLKWFAISVVSGVCFGILDKTSQTQQDVCIVPMHGNLFWLICLNIFSFINLYSYSFSSFRCYSLLLLSLLFFGTFYNATCIKYQMSGALLRYMCVSFSLHQILISFNLHQSSAERGNGGWAECGKVAGKWVRDSFSEMVL